MIFVNLDLRHGFQNGSDEKGIDTNAPLPALRLDSSRKERFFEIRGLFTKAYKN